MFLQLALFIGVITAATVLDIYFDENSVEFETTENEPEQTADDHGIIYLYNPAGTSAVKISILKNSGRKIFENHDKFLQQFHQSNSFKKLKTEQKQSKTPLFLTFHHLLFRNHFSLPDDDPYLS